MYVQSSDSVILQPFHLVVDFIYWIGDSGRDLHSYHRLGMLFLMCFIIIHLYMVIREEIMGKSTFFRLDHVQRIPAAALRKGRLIGGTDRRIGALGGAISSMGMKASASGSRNGSIRGMPFLTTWK